jgi:cytochrome c
MRKISATTTLGRRRPVLRGLLLPVAAAAMVLTALLSCGTGHSTGRIPPAQVPGGNPERGAQLIVSYGCGSCHSIGGIRGADGLVGPPLTTIRERAYIAGRLPNSGPNMERWITDPQGVDPGNAMPDLGVTDEDARDIAAYLFSGDR